MIGFFSLFKDRQNVVKMNEIFFVHIPENSSDEEIKKRFSKHAKAFAEALDVNKVYLNFGKDNFIEYDYKI